jgi:hypothetical protein
MLQLAVTLGIFRVLDDDPDRKWSISELARHLEVEDSLLCTMPEA